jgi:dTDP-glucose 4,6-dehydratase
MKTVLVTGGAGFIGGHLCHHLLEKNLRVLCMDNFVTGNERNIERLYSNDNFKLIRHDITSTIKLKEDIDYVLHFASPASPVDYQKIPIQTLKAGSLGTHNTLGLSLSKKASFLLASTSEVYGDPKVNPQPETYWGNVNPVGPRGCYDEAKRFSEALTVAYKQVHKMNTKIVRIFNTYGPMMRKKDGRAVPNFINQALKNEPITVYGDGNQTRSFCYISDLIEGIYKLMLSDVNDPVNLGNPKEHTVKEVAEMIKELCDSQSEIIYKDLPDDDPQVRCPDINKAIKELNWTPKIKLNEGLKNTIDWFRKT